MRVIKMSRPISAADECRRLVTALFGFLASHILHHGVHSMAGVPRLLWHLWLDCMLALHNQARLCSSVPRLHTRTSRSWVCDTRTRLPSQYSTTSSMAHSRALAATCPSFRP